MWLILLIILILVVILLTIVYFANFYLDFRLLRNNQDDHILIVIHSLWGLVYFKTTISLLDVKLKSFVPTLSMSSQQYEKPDEMIAHDEADISITNIDKLQKILEDIKNYRSFMRPLAPYIRKHVHCTKLHWHTQLGTEDPGLTAMLVGLIYAGKGVILSLGNSIMRFPPDCVVSVRPNYQQQFFHTDLTCIFKGRVGDIIIGKPKLIWHLIRQKGGSLQ